MFIDLLNLFIKLTNSIIVSFDNLRINILKFH